MSAHSAKTHRKRIVVLGAGFAGLTFCQKFKRDDVEIVLVDRQNHHLFQPLLYQVATAGLSVPDIAEPVRKVLRKRPNLRVLLDEVTALNPEARQVHLSGSTLDYDYLVFALGARNNYFGNDQWEAYAPGLKSVDDAARIRRELLVAFEEAEKCDDPERRRQLMTICVVGGGPTGVEMAGAISELARKVLPREFRRIDTRETRVILVEAMDRLLLMFPERLSERARRDLESMGVECRFGHMVEAIDEGRVELDNGEVIEADNIIWTAGVSASPLTAELGAGTDRAGRIEVAPDLSLPGHPEVFCLGDVVSLTDVKGQKVPGISPAAMQMGEHAARLISGDLEAGELREPSARTPFAFFDKGYMATIGRSRAVAKVGRLGFSGFLAWLTWLFVHLIFLIGFRNRVVVLIQWFFGYVNYQRGTRIITGLDRTFRISNRKARAIMREEALARQEDGG